jgi:Transglutaminase-like superfamily
MPNIQRQYAVHDDMTEPGMFGSLYDPLPVGVSALREIVSQLIVHVSSADKYGIPADKPRSRDTRSASDRLRLTVESVNDSLDAARSPHQRTFGTCRDYSLLLCSMLRHRAIAARVRCGFASYFSAAPYQDHWICEYWSEPEQRWCRVDAQLDELELADLGIAFDPANLPRDVYLSADQAWRLVRSGGASPDDFGHGDARGLWFLNVNLHRDLLALANQYTSVWDSWRDAPAQSKHLDESEKAFGDRIAAEITQAEHTEERSSRLVELAAAAAGPRWMGNQQA